MHPASEKQKKYFFVLCADLGYAAEEAKNRAKKKYKLEHFNEIQSDQLSELIELLIGKLESQKKDLKAFDPKILEAGWDTSVCVSCGSECIVTWSQDPPICSRLDCVRRFYGGLIK